MSDSPLPHPTAVSLSHSTQTTPCLLPQLQPVRHCLHAFLSDEDAARLMQVNRSLTTALLSGYRFFNHAFTFERAADVKRLLALYAKYGMCITRLFLPPDWNDPLVDSSTGQPHLPPSLVALSLGVPADRSHRVMHRFLLNATADGSVDRQWTVEAASGEDWEEQLERRVCCWEWSNEDDCDLDMWEVFRHARSGGGFDQPIPSGALPHGLRCLQITDAFKQPLQVGSIPDTVEVLQFGLYFHQPLQVGHLPSSLTDLMFDCVYSQPLLPGVLPDSLRWLCLGSNGDQPLQAGTLPPHLQRLSFGHFYSQPLSPGVIPHSVTYLQLGYDFNQPLLPGVLPASLHELYLGRTFNQPLLPGCLPHGLRVLSFNARASFRQLLQPGVIPASVRALSLGMDYGEQLVIGGIPATVRWLRLPSWYGEMYVSAVLSPATRVIRWHRAF